MLSAWLRVMSATQQCSAHQQQHRAAPAVGSSVGTAATQQQATPHWISPGLTATVGRIISHLQDPLHGDWAQSASAVGAAWALRAS